MKLYTVIVLISSSHCIVGGAGLHGEKVLCYHGPLIYEATCLGTKVKGKKPRYYIHYFGWNENWDQWVPESRVLKYNGANVQKQKELQRSYKVNPRRKNKKSIKRSREGGGKESDSRASAPSQEETTPPECQGPAATHSCWDSSSDVPCRNKKSIIRSRDGGGKESDSRAFTRSQGKTTPSEGQIPSASSSYQDSSSNVPRRKNKKSNIGSGEGGGKESDSRAFTPSQENLTPFEVEGPATSSSYQDSFSDVPRRKNNKSIKSSGEGGGKESDSRDFTPSQEKTTPSEGQGPAASSSCQDSSSDVPRRQNKKSIKMSREVGGKESDSRDFTPSQNKTTASEGQGPAATSSYQDSSSDVPSRKNKKSIKRSGEGGGKEFDSTAFTNFQEETTPSEGQGPAATPSCQDSSSHVPRRKNKKSIKTSREVDGKDSDSSAFTSSQEKTTPSEGQGPAATPSCQDSSAFVPRRKNNKSIKKSIEEIGEESHIRAFTYSQEETTPSEAQGPAASSSYQDSTSDVPRRKNKISIKSGGEGGGKESDSRDFTPSQEKTTPSEDQGPAASSSCQDSTSDVPCRKNKKCIKKSIEEIGEESDSTDFTPSQEKTTPSEGQGPAASSSCQDSSSDVPRRKNKKSIKKSIEEIGEESDSTPVTPSQENTTPSEGQGPAASSSCQDSSLDAPCRKNKKSIKRSGGGGGKECDSRAFTLSQEKKTPSESKCQPATPSSQDSSSDVPRRKNKKSIKRSIEEDGKESDSTDFTPSQEKTTPSEGQCPAASSSCQDSTSDIPRRKNKESIKKSIQEIGEESDSKGFTHSQEKTTSSEAQVPAASSSYQDSTSDVPRRDDKMSIKRGGEGGGKESDSGDFTPSQEKTTPSEGQGPAASSSCQDSTSDVPRRKNQKSIKKSIEEFEEECDSTDFTPSQEKTTPSEGQGPVASPSCQDSSSDVSRRKNTKSIKRSGEGGGKETDSRAFTPSQEKTIPSEGQGTAASSQDSTSDVPHRKNKKSIKKSIEEIGEESDSTAFTPSQEKTKPSEGQGPAASSSCQDSSSKVPRRKNKTSIKRSGEGCGKESDSRDFTPSQERTTHSEGHSSSDVARRKVKKSIKKSIEEDGKESDSTEITPSQEKTPSEGHGPAASSSCQDTSSDVPRRKNKKSIKKTIEEIEEESDSTDFTPSQEKTTPSEAQGPAASSSYQDSTSDIDRKENKISIKRGGEGGGKESDSGDFTPSQEKTTPSDDQGPAASSSCQDSTSDDPRRKNKKSIKKRIEEIEEELDSTAFTPSLEKTEPSEAQAPAASSPCQDSSSDVPRRKIKISIKRGGDGGGKESDSGDFTPSQKKTTPSIVQGPAASSSCQNSTSDVPCRKNMKSIKKSIEEIGDESDSTDFTPSQEKTTPSEGQGPAASSSCQDSSSDVPRRKNKKSIKKSIEEIGEESDSTAFIPSQENTTPSEGQGPAASSSCQDSSSDVRYRKNKKSIKRSGGGGGKESDSGAFTPSQEKTTPSEGQGPEASSSYQDSSSDVPRRKNNKSIEGSREGGGKESDSGDFTPSQEKTTPSEDQGPAASSSCQDSTSDVPRMKNKKSIKRSGGGGGKESDSRAFTLSQEKKTPSESKGQAATPSSQDSSSDVPRRKNMKSIKRSIEEDGKESDSTDFTPSQDKATPSEGQSPAASSSCQDSTSDIPRRKNKKSIKKSIDEIGEESDSKGFTPSQEKTTPSEAQVPAASSSYQDSTSDVPRRENKMSIKRGGEGGGNESDSGDFKPSQEKTTPSEGQGPAASSSCQDSSSDVPRRKNKTSIKRSGEGCGKESDSTAFTPSQEKTTPSESKGQAATPSCQDSSSDVPRRMNKEAIKTSIEEDGKESDSGDFTPSQKKTTPSEVQGPAASSSPQDSTSDVPRRKNKKSIKKSIEEIEEESDSTNFTPSQGKTTPSEGQGPAASSSCQDSSSDVPRRKNKKSIKKRIEEIEEESDSTDFTPSQEKTTPSEAEGPAASSSYQDSTSDVPRRKNKKSIKKSIEEIEEESDSTNFTPSQGKTTPSEGQGPAASSSCQDSSSDVPCRKNKKSIKRSGEGGGKESDSRAFTPSQERTTHSEGYSSSDVARRKVKKCIKKSIEEVGKESDSTDFTPSQEKTPSEGQGPAASSSCQDSSSDVPRRKNKKSIKKRIEEIEEESDSTDFTPSQEKTTPSEAEGPAASSSYQDSTSDVPRRKNKISIKRGGEGGGKESDSGDFTPSQEKTTPSECQGPAASSSRQDSTSDVPRRKNKKSIKKRIEEIEEESDSIAFTPSLEKTTPTEAQALAAASSYQDSTSDVPHRKNKISIKRGGEGGGKEFDSGDFTPSQKKTTPSEDQGPAASSPCQDSTSDVPCRKNKKSIKRNGEGGGKESDSGDFTPSQKKTTPSEGQGPAASSSSCQDSSSDVPCRKNKKSIKRSGEGGRKESDSRAFTPSQEKIAPSESRGQAATPYRQDSSSDVPRRKNKKSIKKSIEEIGEESDSSDFTPSQEKTTTSEGQGPAASSSCQDSSSDVPRGKNKKSIKRSGEGRGKESDSRPFTPSQEKTTPSKSKGQAATPSHQESSSDVPRRKNKKSIKRSIEEGGKESDSTNFAPSQEKTTPSEGQGPAESSSCQDSTSDVPRRKNKKSIKKSIEEIWEESDSTDFTPFQERATPSEGQGIAASSSCQDSSSDVPRRKSKKSFKKSIEEIGEESDSTAFTPSQEKTTPSQNKDQAATLSCQDSSSDVPSSKNKKSINRSGDGGGKEYDRTAFTPSQEETTPSKGQGPAATPSSQDSSSHVPRRKNKKSIKTSGEGDGKESDSSAFTPSQEKTTPSEGQGPAATSSCQDSSSDVPRRKNKNSIKRSGERGGKESDSGAFTPSQQKTTPCEGQGAAAGPSRKVSSSCGRRKKRGQPRRRDPSVQPEEPFLRKVEAKVKIPDELKPWLVYDNDYITVQHKIVNLPAKISVDQIFENYVKHKTSNESNTPDKEAELLEVTNGLKEYFNVMLGSQLLCRFERYQYAEILQNHPDTPMSKVYGAIHLLRLFVKLESMLASTPLDKESIQTLLIHVHDILRYLQENAASLFSLHDYELASREYHHMAM